MRAIKCGEASADSIRRNVEQTEETQQTLLPEIQNLAVNAELGLKSGAAKLEKINCFCSHH